jgi:hypothetical protein
MSHKSDKKHKKHKKHKKYKKHKKNKQLDNSKSDSKSYLESYPESENVSKSDPTIDVYKDAIYCPITLQIFCEPVMASDGHIYERVAIDEILSKNNPVSPITKETLTKTLVTSHVSISIRDEILQKYPDLKKDVYVPIKTHTKYKDQVSQIIKDKQFQHLLHIIEFQPKLFVKDDLMVLFQNGSNDVIKYVIDNLVDINQSRGNNMWRIPHYICRYCNGEIIQYMLKTTDVKLCMQTPKGSVPSDLLRWNKNFATQTDQGREEFLRGVFAKILDQ